MSESTRLEYSDGLEFTELKQVITGLVGDLIKRNKLSWIRTTGASDLYLGDWLETPLVGYHDVNFLIEMNHKPRREEEGEGQKDSKKKLETVVYPERLEIQFYVLNQNENLTELDQLIEHLEAVSDYNYESEHFDHEVDGPDLPEQVDSKYSRLFDYRPDNPNDNLVTDWTDGFYGTASAQEDGEYQSALRVVAELKKIKSATDDNMETKE